MGCSMDTGLHPRGGGAPPLLCPLPPALAFCRPPRPVAGNLRLLLASHSGNGLTAVSDSRGSRPDQPHIPPLPLHCQIPAVHDFGLFMSLIVSCCWLAVLFTMPAALGIWSLYMAPLESACQTRWVGRQKQGRRRAGGQGQAGRGTCPPGPFGTPPSLLQAL